MKKVLLFLLSIFMVVVLVGCSEEEKSNGYKFKLKITDGTNEWIFEPDETRKTYEMEYTGEEVEFKPISFYITEKIGSPNIEEKWLSTSDKFYISVDTLHNTLDGQQIEYNGGKVKERGEYWIYFYSWPTGKWEVRQMLFVVNVV